MIHLATKRAIAVIAYSELQAVKTDMSKAMALAAGCRDADVLLVDGGMVPYLTEDWVKVAASVMRYQEIYVHDRATYELARVRVE
jgi:hypothetical protein